MNRYTVLVTLDGHTQTTGVETNDKATAERQAAEFNSTRNPAATHKYIVADLHELTINHVERFADDMIVATGQVAHYRFVARVHPLQAQYIDYYDWMGVEVPDARQVHNSAVVDAVELAMAKTERTYHVTYGERTVIEFSDRGDLVSSIDLSARVATRRVQSLCADWVETGVVPEEDERTYLIKKDDAGNNVVQYLSDGEVCGWTTQGYTLAQDHRVTREDLDTMGELWVANGMDWLATV